MLLLGKCRKILALLLCLAGCQANTKEQTLQEIETARPLISEEETMETIYMHLNNTTLTIKLYKHESVDTFMQQLPMELEMNDLHGNEKYYYFNQTFPTQPKNITFIERGDIMLYGNNCLVLFYKDVDTSFAYTRMGYVEDKKTLQEIVSEGSMKIRFTKEKTE